jgi:hypothetical protein
VYALGAILYELLTGQVPFRGRSVLETLEQVRTQPPRPLRELRPDVPPGLEAVCLKALQKPTLLRYATMAEMAADLGRFLSAAEGPPGLYQPGRGARLLTRRACLIGAGLLVPAVVAGGWSALRRRETPREDEPVPPQVLPPLKGWVDVRVWKKSERKAFHLDEAGVLPVERGDEIAIVAEVNRPAYLYVFWINPDGTVAPVYPWRPGRWEERPAEETPITQLRRPQTATNFYPLTKGQSGMETLLLLAREQPWPAAVDVRALLAGLPPQTEQNAVAAVWLENGQVVKGEPGRDVNFFDETRREDPVLLTQHLLRERLGDQVVYSRAVSFANQGK